MGTARSIFTRMSFIPKQYKGASGGGKNDDYMTPGKVKADGQIRFALLAEEPLCYFECRGEDKEGNGKPFRFVDEPSPSDIEAEMGPNFERRTKEDGSFEPVKFAISVPIYSYDLGKVQTLSMTQKGLQKELDEISQVEEYSDLLCWDFILTKAAPSHLTCMACARCPARRTPRKPLMLLGPLLATTVTTSADFSLAAIPTSGIDGIVCR